MAAPNPYLIYIELFLSDGVTRPNQNQIARVNAYDVNGATVTWQGQCGFNPATGGWFPVYMQNVSLFSPPRDQPNLRFEVVNTAEQIVHTTQVFATIPNQSTVRIVIGVGAVLVGGGSNPNWQVTGHVRTAFGAPVSPGSVIAYDVTNGVVVTLGTATLTADGAYSITYSQSSFANNGAPHSQPNLRVKAFDSLGRVIAESNVIVATSNQILDLTVEEAPGTLQYRVFGNVENQLDLPVSGISLQAFHVAWLAGGITEVALGTATSGAGGAYEILYQPPAPSGTPTACSTPSGKINLLVYARDGATTLATSTVILDASREERVDLAVDRVSVGSASEYERVHAALSACLGSTDTQRMDALNQLNARPEYLSFVAQASAQSEELVRAYTRAWLIAAEINTKVQPAGAPAVLSRPMAADVVYGLLRITNAANLVELLNVSPEEFFEAMIRAVHEGVIAATREADLYPSAAFNNLSLIDDWRTILMRLLARNPSSNEAGSWQQQLLSLVFPDWSEFPELLSATGTGFSGDTTATHQNHNVPMPASVVAGDLLLVLFANDGSASVTTPSGWTQLWTTPAGTTTAVRFGGYAKVAAGSEGGTTVNFVTSAAEQAAAQVYRISKESWSGVLTGPSGIVVASPATGTGTFPNPPLLTISPPNYPSTRLLFIACAAHDREYLQGATQPGGGYTPSPALRTGSSANTGACTILSARRTVEGEPQSDDPGTFSFLTGDDWVAMTLAIRPFSQLSKREAVIAAHFDSAGSFPDMIASLKASGQLSDAEVKNLTFVFELYERVGRFFPIVESIYGAKASRGWVTVADLATVTLDSGPAGAGWLSFAGGASAIPADIPGSNNDERVAVYAARLLALFGEAAPDERFVFQMAADAAFQPVTNFIAAHPTFNLYDTNVDRFIQENAITIPDAERAQIKQIQRVFRITPHFDAAKELIGAGYDSAVKIAAREEGQFIADNESLLGGVTAARDIFRAADHTATEVLSTLAKYHQDLTDVGGMASIPGPVDFTVIDPTHSLVDVDEEPNPDTRKFPNWVTLFGSLNQCACKRCQTVLSPGAYLVDLIQFCTAAGDRTLLERRPDLEDIELTCTNTFTVLPYIDLVNEVLENVVEPLDFALELEDSDDDPLEPIATMNSAAGGTAASLESVRKMLTDRGYLLADQTIVKIGAVTDLEAVPPIREWVIEDDAWRFSVRQEVPGAFRVFPSPQTSSTNDSLEVFPEHFNVPAYNKLRDAKFPFNLPLDLGREEAEIVVKQRGLRSHEVLEAFSIANALARLGADRTALAYLDLGVPEAVAVLGKDGSVRSYWGFSNSTATIPRPDKPLHTIEGDWKELLSLVPVFLHRSGLKYEELRELLDTEFVHQGAGHSHGLHLAASQEDLLECDIGDFQIAHLEEENLRRISFFVRLWRKLGWSMREVDRYLCQLEEKDIPEADPDGTTEASELVRLSLVKRLKDRLRLPPLAVPALWVQIDTRRSPRHPRSLFDEVFLSGTPDQPELALLESVARGSSIDLGEVAEDVDLRGHIRGALHLKADDFEELWEKHVGSASSLTRTRLTALYRAAIFATGLRINVRTLFDLVALTELDPVPGTMATESTLRAAILDTHAALQQFDVARSVKPPAAELLYLSTHKRRDGKPFLLGEEPFVVSERHLAEAATRLASAVAEIAQAHPEQPNADAVALATVLSTLMNAANVGTALAIVESPEATQKNLDFVTRHLAKIVGAAASFLSDLAARPLAERYSRVFGQIRAHLVDQARTNAVIQIASDLMGIDADTANSYLTRALSGLSSPPPVAPLTEYPSALAQWKAFLLGGWNTGEAVIVDRPSGTRRTRVVIQRGGLYRFVASVNATAGVSNSQFVLLVDGVPRKFAGTTTTGDGRTEVAFAPLTLRAGDIIAVRFGYTGSAQVSLLWQIDTDDPVPVPATAGVPLDDRAYTKLFKASRLVKGLGMTKVELEWLLDRPNADETVPDLDLLPYDEDEPRVAWSRLARLIEVVGLNRSVRMKDQTLFEFWRDLAPGLPEYDDDSEDEGVTLVSSQTEWRIDDIEAVLGLFSDVPAWDDPALWFALRGAFRVVRRLDIRANLIRDLLVTRAPNLRRAVSLRNAVRSQFSKDAWKEAFKPLRDPLRRRQRDALVGYLTSRTITLADKPFDFFDANDLFAHFLIDVEMEPDTLLSRVKLALNAIQLFVHRVFFGLEPAQVFANPPEAKRQWAWMERYRVWEANRKVFLYPENWIEPELRDDKSEFFLELEAQLEQGKLSGESAQIALADYLEKLRDVSNLEIIGAFAERTFSIGTNQVLHIVGRSRSRTRTFYYRTFTAKQSHDGSFTPWKEIKLEINADVVAPVVWNGRLHLFWPKIITKEKPQPGGTPADDASAEYQSEIQIMWSEYIPKKNKWSKARIGKTRLTDYNAPSPFQRDIGDDQARTENYHIRASLEPDHISITLFRTDVPTGPTQTVWRAERLQREVRNWFGQVRIEEYVDNVPHQVPSSLNLMELGVFHVWQSGEDTVEPSGLDWSKAGIGNNHPRGTVLKSNASIEVEFAVEEELANDALKFQGFVQFLARTPDLFRVFAPNLGSFVDNKLLEPFFFETPLKSTFALPQPSPYAPSFFFGFFNFATATRFSTFHHPLVQDFERIHNEYGTEGLMTRLTQALPLVDGRYYSNYYYNYYGQLYLGYHIAGDTQAWGTTQRMFETEHEPNTVTVIPPYPLPTVEFGYGTSFGVYNWELFFHLPMLVGGLLSQDLQFEEAMKWYHYVFDPKQTLNDYERTKEWVSTLPTGARFWNFLPFFANRQTTDSLAETLGFNATAPEHEKNELTAVLDEWRNNPFKPHLIARHRMSAYQKFVVMKYLDNLIAWGDSLFRQDTFETINEATQLYVIAEEILGQRPEQVEPLTGSPRHTYRELSALGFGPLSNAVTEVESLVVSSKPHLRSHQSVVRTSGMRALSGVAIQSLFFRIPRNEKLDQYWEVVQDRLFKIRNSMNIDGVKRQLALFEPPIDPALLVRAVAAGLDIGSVLAQLGAPLPCYRFSTWIQRAVDVANELRGFGGAFLAALEKKDAEELQQLRQTHEIRMLELVRVVRRQQVAEAESNIEALEASRAIAEERQAEYRRRAKISRGELAQIDRTKAATAWDVKAGSLHALAAAFSSVPDSTIGTNGLELATRSHFKIGAALQGAASAHAHGAGTFASLARGEAALAALTAGFDRRWEDWKLQERLAQKEVAQINQQLAVARIRLSIAEKELDNHETATEQAEEMLEFLKDKFTSKDLYQWMVRELSRSYQKVYKLAYDAAKTAERTFQFELGVEDPAFVQFDYRDSLREGLLAGEKLIVDLKRLEHAYLERNKRELEIQKSVSLAQLNGEALQKLRETGTCTFDLSEVLFDLDFPGHYFRRVKAVRLTIPCVTGPHTSVSAKLTLLSSVFRKEATLATPEEYPFTGVDDPRFAHNPIGIQSIATGTAQGDAGLFTLDFRDERYLPFEGGGVVSRWRLELPADPRQFDYATISDVVIQLSYTARDGGDVLKQGAVQSLTEGEVPGLNRIREFVTAPPEETAPLGLVRVFSLRKDFPDAFQRLLVTEGEPGVELTLLPEHFPFVLRDAGLPLALTDGSETETQEIGVHIVAKLAPATGAPEPTLTGATLSVTAEGGAAAPVTLTDPTEGSVIEESIDIGDSALVPEWSEQRFKLIQQGLSPTNVDDIVLVAKYAVSATG